MIIYGSRIVSNVETVVQILDAPVTATAVHKATLMKEDYVKLSFVDVTDYHFKAGDYVTLGGQNYYLNKDYIPTMKDEATYSYELQFNAPWYNLDSYIFFFNTYVIDEQTQEEEITKRESDWYITDTASNIINLLIKNTQDGTRDCPCVFDSVFYCEGTTVKTFTFSSTSILAALNNLAKEFELEWWVEVNNGSYFLHFGECDDSIIADEYGSVIFNADGSRKKGAVGTTLTVGSNVSAPSISNKNDIKKKYFVYGSSRNIDQTVDMLSREDGTYVSSLVTKRLAMEGNPQTHESNPTIITEDIGYGEEVVIFDDIYPRSDWQITHVDTVEIQTDEVIGYEEDETPIYKKYNAYNVRLGSAHKEGNNWVVDDPNGFSDYVFDLIENDPDVQYIRDVIASGKELSLKFIIKDVNSVTYTPILAGFEFELGAFLNVNINGEFPNKPDSYEWYEFQIIKQEINSYIIPNNTLIPQVGDWVCLFNIKGKYIDANEQTNAQTELTEAFKKYYKNLKKDVSYTVKPYVDSNLNLNVGNSVKLAYGGNEVRSRISSYEKKLDYEIDASYVISSYVQPSTVNQLKEEVKTITANIASGRALVLDSEAINSMLDLYGGRKFISKVQDDEASGIITFNNLVKIANKIGSPTFQGGFTGSGWQVENDSITVDSLTVRQTMRVFELLIQQVKATGGEIIVSPANGKIKSVTSRSGGAYYDLTLETGTGFGNMFHTHDLVRCQRWDKNLNTIRSYWTEVTDVRGETIVVSGSGIPALTPPEVGDELVLMGNTTDTTRQSAISISATTDGTPKITVLNGISSTSLTNCTKAVFGCLNGITDTTLNPSGYGLYSDNVFLKGKLAFSNGTLVSDELTRISSGEIELNGKTTVDDDFFAKNIETIPNTTEDENNQARTKISGSLMEVFGSSGKCNIRFGVNESGYAVMQYFDNDGALLYDLGPEGLNYAALVEEGFISAAYKSGSLSNYRSGQNLTDETFFQYKAKRINQTIAGGDYTNNDASLARQANGRWFTSDQTIVSNNQLTNLVNNNSGEYYKQGTYVGSINGDPHGCTTLAELKLYMKNKFEFDTVSELDPYNFGWGGSYISEYGQYMLDSDIKYQTLLHFTSGVPVKYYDIWQPTH